LSCSCPPKLFNKQPWSKLPLTMSHPRADLAEGNTLPGSRKGVKCQTNAKERL